METYTDKSHVTMERAICIVCTAEHDTGAILLDTRLRKVFDRNTVTGWGMCADCERLKDDGYLALVGIDPDKSETSSDGDTIKPEDAHRTGNIVHIKNDVFGRMFDVEIPESGVAFVDPEVIERLAKMEEEREGAEG